MLYLIENPVIREAFFPTTAVLTAVEPAGSAMPWRSERSVRGTDYRIRL